MSYIITIQYPYNYLTVTLSEDTTIIVTTTISKFQAIAGLIPALQNILTAHNLKLADIACIGVNTGPGPFNTLRSIIATANAISFAQHIPLVGCNGLELLLQEHLNSNLVVILDAFGNDVYFAIKSTGERGYDSIENVLAKVKFLDQKNIIFIGNGAVKHQELIVKNFDDQASYFANPAVAEAMADKLIDEDILFTSTQSLVNATYQNFVENKIEQEIFPLYFASPVVKN